MNQGNYQAWLECVNDGRKAVTTLLRPDPHFHFFRAVAAAMEQGWVELSALEQAHGLEIRAALKPLLEQWERAGLVEMRGDVLVLTLAGQFWQVNLSHLMQDFLKHVLESSTDR